MVALLALVLIANIVLWIMVLIKMFKHAGAVHGIIGIICSLYAFIWGWMNAGKYGIRNIMLAWTGLIILNIILNVTTGGFASYMGGMPTTP